VAKDDLKLSRATRKLLELGSEYLGPQLQPGETVSGAVIATLSGSGGAALGGAVGALIMKSVDRIVAPGKSLAAGFPVSAQMAIVATNRRIFVIDAPSHRNNAKWVVSASFERTSISLVVQNRSYG
jgi:predicted metal-dependent HD superfamily phosphohydrolase